jgi:NAD(P)H dehydrogenase (quinone)
MAKTLVTGVTGHLGRETLLHLLKRRPATELIGLARDPTKVSDLVELGVEIRKGDYFDYDSLLSAFADVEKVMLVATTAFSDRNKQHYNVIAAARQAGVKHIVYTAIIRREGSRFVLPEGTVEDTFAEQMVQASGMTYTIVRHPPYLETIQFQIGDKAYETGVRVPAGEGKAGYALRDELGEAQAVILTGAGHDNKIYSLAGDPVSFKDIATFLSGIRGTSVPYVPISESDFVKKVFVNEGLPEFLGWFACAWVAGINSGEYDRSTDDLETLLGRKPTTASEYLRGNYPTALPQVEAIRQRSAT